MNRKERRKFASNIQKSKGNYQKVFYNKFLAQDSDDKMDKFLGHLEKEKLFDSSFRSMLFPADISELGKKNFIYNPMMPESSIDIWVKNIFRLYSKEISTYIRVRSEYENFLFAGKYEKAKEKLNEIEEICVSLWSCGQRFLLVEESEGLEANKELLESFLKKISSGIISLMVVYGSLLAEKNMSYTNYQDGISKLINQLPEQKYMGNYIKFKLDLENDIENILYSEIIQIDSQISIIDLYESYVELLQIKSTYTQNEIDILDEFKVLGDYRLQNLAFINKPLVSCLDIQSNIDWYNNLEKYTIGLYTEVEIDLKEYLQIYPSDFQAVTLYIKTCINLRKKIEPLLPIYNDIYNLYCMNTKTDQSVINIWNSLKRYRGTSWRMKIEGLISRKITLKNIEFFSYLSHINDFQLSPDIVTKMNNKETKICALAMFREVCPQTAELCRYFINLVEDLSKDSKVDNYRKSLLIAKKEVYLMNNLNAEKLLKQLLLETKEDDFYNLEKIYCSLIEALYNNGKCLEMLETLCEIFFANKNLIKRMPLDTYIQILKTNAPADIRQSICYPICIYLNGKKDYISQKIAYLNYKDYNHIFSSDELVNQSIEKNKLVFFLDKLCSLNIIKRDVRMAKTGIIAEDIRIQILRKLIEIDDINQKKYYEEITKITTQKGVRDRLKQINESRIYVDANNIYLEYKDLFEEDFEKHLIIKRFSKTILTVNTTDEKYTDQLYLDMKERTKVDASHNQASVVLENLMSRIKEEFLFNEKYGLNTFLSSRIRHGYCKNQLTMVFKEFHLLSMKEEDKSQEYVVNNFWDETLPKESNGSYLFKNCLSEFSKRIEEKVEEIRNIWLKIRFKEREVGLLDFRTSMYNIILIDSDSFDDCRLFYNHIINLLWKITEANLKLLRVRIHIELKKFFYDQLDNLKHSILEISDSSLDEAKKIITSNINLCKPKVEAVTNEFSRVFFKKDVVYKEFKMEDLLITTTGISQKLYNGFDNIKYNSNVISKSNWKGEMFPYFVDILGILVNNAVMHSCFIKREDLEIMIEIIEDIEGQQYEEYLSEFKENGLEYNSTHNVLITVENNLKKSVNLEMVLTEIQNRFTIFSKGDVAKEVAQSEGGTGLYKVFNILKYNMNGFYGIFFKVEDHRVKIEILIGSDNILN